MALATRQQQQHVVAACYLGWTLDAFDFFILVFVLRDVARDFDVSITTVTLAITLTLALRPVGAWLFGRVADRFGRRPTLMANVTIYSLLEFFSGLAPNLTTFILLRALYGVAMGGEWGVGASLTMESIPARWRGPVSGLLQAGYPSGYLLSSLVYWAAYAAVGWRGMFMIGVIPALLVLYIRRTVPESPDWERRTAAERRASMLSVLRAHLPLSIFAIVMMTAFNFFSHGTQDLYPTYLQVQRHLTVNEVTVIVIIYNIGAIIGGIGFGTLSQFNGRRIMIVIAALLSLPTIPLWAFSADPVWIAVGAFLMQVFVQGAWGIIPAHLNELSPPEVRGTFPGLVYQLGNLLASANATIQSSWADSMGHDYSWALAGVVIIVATIIAVLVGFGPEAREIRMGLEAEPAPVH
ncbi:MAG: MFS transporter [Acetobacteraceae bacterium]|nr:MFS transporter [Acetobacteraceae bacterium]MBV8592204.1 MFS transporter [Acetobacteraceae bacterium]